MKGSNWILLVLIAPLSILLGIVSIVLLFAPDPIASFGASLALLAMALVALTAVTTPIGIWRDSKHISDGADWSPRRSLPWIGIFLGPLVGTYYVVRRLE